MVLGGFLTCRHFPVENRASGEPEILNSSRKDMAEESA